MNRSLRWGVLSTAKIAQKELLPAFQRAENAVVNAIASQSNSGKAKEVAEQFHIEKVYDSYEELLNDKEIDAVYIPLPNHLHKKWAIEAANQGKHILLEKPAALNAEETEEIGQACKDNGVHLMEAFMYHFHPQHDRVKEIIGNGEIGDVKFIRSSFSFYLGKKENNIKMATEKGGGSLYDVGCYTLHAMRNILQTEPEWIHAYADADPEYGVDISVTGFLNFPNGVRGVFDAGFDRTKRAEYEVIGTEGTIRVPRAFRPDWNGGDGLVIVEKTGSTRTETIQADQYKEEVELFSRAVLQGTEPAHTWENTIGNMRVIDACFASIHQQSAVKLH
ncbi:Gfo/Idh/MocA family protein [Virgibacillus xinjiangensis]|uniref:Gfo/Idh/MocA family protein n=1 Tax=Virgibacillus xinjiangensis TaxID=393090 RepID=A0ABV7CSW5_9BACI